MRTLLLTASLVAAIAAATFATGAPPASAAGRCANADAPPSALTITQSRRAAICLVNRERSRRHLPRLRERGQLRRVATRHARDMVARRFFAHVCPAGSTMFERIQRSSYLDGARRWDLGENLAWGAQDGATPAQIVAGWMQSPGHRANVLHRRYRDIGIGIVRGAPAHQAPAGAATYVAQFGRRRG